MKVGQKHTKIQNSNFKQSISNKTHNMNGTGLKSHIHNVHLGDRKTKSTIKTPSHQENHI